MCMHEPPCPPVDQPGWDTASVLIHHADLGWSMLCNGAIVLDSVAAVVPIQQRRKRRTTPVVTAALPLAA